MQGLHIVYTDFMPEKDQLDSAFYSGAIEFEAKEVKAGETVTVTGDWNWLDPNYSNDWSVTAWGNKGPVIISHKLGLESDKMPVAPAKKEEEVD